MPNSPKNKLSYIPGRNGHYLSGLGNFLQALNIEYIGVSMMNEMLSNNFDSQLAYIYEHLRQSQPTHVIANSYGAYLLMHVLLANPDMQFKILLLSPVLGKGITLNRLVIPPRSKKLMTSFENGTFPRQPTLEIHTGEFDNGCDPKLAQFICDLGIATRCNVIPNQTHMIDKTIVQRIVRDFIK